MLYYMSLAVLTQWVLFYCADIHIRIAALYCTNAGQSSTVKVRPDYRDFPVQFNEVACMYDASTLATIIHIIKHVLKYNYADKIQYEENNLVHM